MDAAERLQKEGYFSIEEKEVITYGIKQGKKFVLSVIATLILRMIFQVFVAAVALIPLRKFAGGYHADTSCRCTVISVISISCCFYFISKGIEMNYVILGVLVSFAIILCMAPVQNDKNHLNKAEPFL